MSISDEKIFHDIETYGCSVLHILAEGELPPYAFSLGITQVSQASEVVVIELKQPVALAVINEYNRRIRYGERFHSGQKYAELIQGFEMLALTVDESFYESDFGYARWYYGDKIFEILQLIYPNTSGVWPWEPQANEWIRNGQPILSHPLRH